MPDRIASLLPSATETLFALGLGDRVVAVSHACDHPPEARALPKATRTRVDPEATSQAIDQAVRSATETQDPIYTVDEGVIHHVQPDVIVTQDTCSVCAAGPEHVHAALMRIEPVDRPEILTLHAHTLDDVLDDIEHLGQATGATQATETLLSKLRDRIHAVRAAAGQADDRPRVAVLDWLDPPMAAGHWIPDMVELAGGQPTLVAPGDPSTYVDWDDIVAAEPEVLILAACGFDIPRTRKEAATLQDRPGWEDIPAIQADRVHVMDGDQHTSRPGPRLIDALEAMASVIHPDQAPALPETHGRLAPKLDT